MIQPVTQESNQLITELDQELGPGGGDWIKAFAGPAAKILGQSNCMSCEARRVVVNAYGTLKGKYGMIKALSLIKELWKKSFTQSEEEVLKTLKEYLDA